MTRSVRDIEQDIRSLRTAHKNQLLRDLIAGIDDGEPDQDLAGLWLQEAQQRYGELQSGTAKPVPAEVVFRDARSRLKHDG